jgi:hypothetical protein
MENYVLIGIGVAVIVSQFFKTMSDGSFTSFGRHYKLENDRNLFYKLMILQFVAEIFALIMIGLILFYY